ncbi:MAG: acyltransferase [Rubrivivax sp.]|nr:MAG: acyltransferase [Rubrivivax sp.]
MDAAHPLFALAALLLAFGTAWGLQRRFGAPPALGRYDGVDGLRGYLAFGVFLHHACIWFFYQQGGVWKLPPSQLYAHLGNGSVTVFFMITAFLFFSKLIDARRRPLDWLRLFVSRVLRLVPLYLVVMAALFAIVAVLSTFQLREPAGDVASQALHWLGFTMLGHPQINHVAATTIVTAGVTWSLPYEWFFYGTLPLLALTVGVVPRWPWLLLGGATLAAMVAWHAAPNYLIAFSGGILAAWCTRSPAMCRWAGSHAASVVVLALAASVGFLPQVTGYRVLALLSLAFVLIASGNTVFGLLRHPASRLLGEMAYSIYLVHGLLLFVLFHFALGADRPGASLAASVYWAWALGLAPVLVCVCFASFRFIEAPAMQATAAVTAALRRRLPSLEDRQPA